MNSVPSSFWEWIAQLNSGERFGLIAITLIASVLVVLIVFITLYKVHKNRLEAALKRELLERNMSADEIATVIRATPTTVPHRIDRTG